MSEPSATGATAVDAAIAQGIDLNGAPLPSEKLEVYNKVMGLEQECRRTEVIETMRSRIIRIGVRHLPQNELNQMLIVGKFIPLTEKEIAFYYR